MSKIQGLHLKNYLSSGQIKKMLLSLKEGKRVVSKTSVKFKIARSTLYRHKKKYFETVKLGYDIPYRKKEVFRSLSLKAKKIILEIVKYSPFIGVNTIAAIFNFKSSGRDRFTTTGHSIMRFFKTKDPLFSNYSLEITLERRWFALEGLCKGNKRLYSIFLKKRKERNNNENIETNGRRFRGGYRKAKNEDDLIWLNLIGALNDSGQSRVKSLSFLKQNLKNLFLSDFFEFHKGKINFPAYQQKSHARMNKKFRKNIQYSQTILKNWNLKKRPNPNITNNHANNPSMPEARMPKHR